MKNKKYLKRKKRQNTDFFIVVVTFIFIDKIHFSAFTESVKYLIYYYFSSAPFAPVAPDR